MHSGIYDTFRGIVEKFLLPFLSQILLKVSCQFVYKKNISIMAWVNFSVLLFFISLVLPSFVFSQSINKSTFRKIAVEGTDVVAYFTEGKAIPGKPEFSHEWKNAKWLFSNQKHLDLFRKNPNAYAPAYGGFCAYAMSSGEKYGISPNSWHIENGRLFLNYDEEVQKEWMEKRADFIKKADEAWKEIVERNK